MSSSIVVFEILDDSFSEVGSEQAFKIGDASPFVDFLDGISVSNCVRVEQVAALKLTYLNCVAVRWSSIFFLRIC